MFHPHIHCIVTGGGLTAEDKWQTSRKKFFLPVKVLSRKFRGKFLCFLKQAVLSFDAALYQNEWVVYCKPPFKKVSKVIEYLGRYTHRMVASWKSRTLTAVEFIRRFILHILPSGFRKIRHYGILAARGKSNRIAFCKKLTRTKLKLSNQTVATIDRLHKILGANFDLCPRCGIGHLPRASPGGKTA